MGFRLNGVKGIAVLSLILLIASFVLLNVINRASQRPSPSCPACPSATTQQSGTPSGSAAGTASSASGRSSAEQASGSAATGSASSGTISTASGASNPTAQLGGDSSLEMPGVTRLSGSEESLAVSRALSTDEYARVAEALRKLGYRPARERALAVRFTRSLDSESAEFTLVAIPFEGGQGSAFALVLVKPTTEALAFEVSSDGRKLRLVAREPADQPSAILPESRVAALSESRCNNPQPSCEYCKVARCVCREWDVQCLIECCSGCAVPCFYCAASCAKGDLLGCAVNCALCAICIVKYCIPCTPTCCTSYDWSCYRCYPYYCHLCCATCDLCKNDPLCNTRGNTSVVVTPISKP